MAKRIANTLSIMEVLSLFATEADAMKWFEDVRWKTVLQLVCIVEIQRICHNRKADPTPTGVRPVSNGSLSVWEPSWSPPVSRSKSGPSPCTIPSQPERVSVASNSVRNLK